MNLHNLLINNFSYVQLRRRLRQASNVQWAGGLKILPRFQVVGVVVKVGHLSLLQYKESHLWDFGLLYTRELRTALHLCVCAIERLYICGFVLHGTWFQAI